MTDYESNITLPQLAEKLRAMQRIVITTHSKPDGDAFGSMIALAAALRHMGKDVQRWIMPPLPANLGAIMPVDEKVFQHDTPEDPLPDGEPDGIVIVDTGAWSQLQRMQRWLEPRCDRITVIDHHLSGNVPAAHRFIDHSASATAEMIADLIDAMNVPIDSTIAAALYAGIASDTGWFRFSNTSARTHRLAARLIETGIDHAMLYQSIEQTERPQKLLLAIKALDSLQFFSHGRVAVMTLKAHDFKVTGALPEETERLVDMPQVVGVVKVVVLLTEVRKKLVRVSFRSKPGPDTMDVNVFAQKFGGGGHARAAGARIEDSLDAVRARIIGELEKL